MHNGTQAFVNVVNAYTDLVHRLTENDSTFAHEYSQRLKGIAAEEQSLIKEQVKAASDGSDRTGKAPAAAHAKAPGKTKSSRWRRSLPAFSVCSGATNRAASRGGAFFWP